MGISIKTKNSYLTIHYSKNLEDFSNEFINYYKEHIDRIKEELMVTKQTRIIVMLTDDIEKAGFVYGKSSFSGFFNDKGAFAYINLNGDKTKEYIFKGLMHELTHHLYKYYVYGKEKERITWVDEGLAQFLSLQKEDLKDEKKYRLFLEENLKHNINLNELNHNDRSFGKNNGYNLSYIAIRYLYETNSHEEFIEIIKSQEKILEYGSIIIEQIKNNQSINNKTI